MKKSNVGWPLIRSYTCRPLIQIGLKAELEKWLQLSFVRLVRWGTSSKRLKGTLDFSFCFGRTRARLRRCRFSEPSKAAGVLKCQVEVSCACAKQISVGFQYHCPFFFVHVLLPALFHFLSVLLNFVSLNVPTQTNNFQTYFVSNMYDKIQPLESTTSSFRRWSVFPLLFY